MNHFPIYGNRAPAFCTVKGDTANPELPVDCPHCQRRLQERAEAYRGIANAARRSNRPYHEHLFAAQAITFESRIA